MTADLRALLDRLDTDLAAATPGPWRQQSDYPSFVEGRDAFVCCTGEAVGPSADAALIVAAVNALPGLLAAVRAVLDKHVPWYEVDGVRHDNTVNVGCDQHATCEGDADAWCSASDGDGHEVLACSECRCVVDYDVDGFLLWPCPTAQALAAALTEGDAPA